MPDAFDEGRAAEGERGVQERDRQPTLHRETVSVS